MDSKGEVARGGKGCSLQGTRSHWGATSQLLFSDACIIINITNWTRQHMFEVLGTHATPHCNGLRGAWSQLRGSGEGWRHQSGEWGTTKAWERLRNKEIDS